MKLRTSIMNVPTEPITPEMPTIENKEKPNRTEYSEFYLIHRDYVETTPDNKKFYSRRRLIRLADTLRLERYIGDEELEFVPYTDGKETLYTERHRGYGPMFRINMKGEYTFYPRFFEAIGKCGLVFLRITGPMDWHIQNNLPETRYIDPQIDLLWAPKRG